MKTTKLAAVVAAPPPALGSAAGSFVRMFMPQFAPLVESGAKLQTVRPTPKRMPKPGDRISLRGWSGKPYRSKQRVLRESIITEVTPIELCFIRCRLLIWIRGEKPRHLNTAEIEAFARADGFHDAAEMAHWFQMNHGLPFAGVLIVWRNTEISNSGHHPTP